MGEEILADQAMHDKELADMQDALTFFFPEKEYGKVQVTVDWNEHSLRKVGLATGRFNKYYRFDFPKEKHTVIAVQGTDPSDYRDVIVDFRLWFISILVDWSETLIFLMNLLPERNRARLQWVIDQIVTKFTIDESRLDFFAPVVQYVHEVITTDQTNGYTYITGNEACPGRGHRKHRRRHARRLVCVFLRTRILLLQVSVWNQSGQRNVVPEAGTRSEPQHSVHAVHRPGASL